MKKKLVSLVLVGAMAMSLMACGGGSSNSGSEAAGKTEGGSQAAGDVQSSDENTLTVFAWDENFNIPALKAAEKDFQEKNPDFKLEIITQADSKAVEQAVTLAGGAGDYSTLPDIVLFQDHYFQKFHQDYPDAWQSANDATCDWNGQAIYADIVNMTQNVQTVEQNDFHYSAREFLGTHLQKVVAGEEDEKAALEAAESELKFEMGL